MEKFTSKVLEVLPFQIIVNHIFLHFEVIIEKRRRYRDTSKFVIQKVYFHFRRDTYRKIYSFNNIKIDGLIIDRKIFEAILNVLPKGIKIINFCSCPLVPKDLNYFIKDEQEMVTIEGLKLYEDNRYIIKGEKGMVFKEDLFKKVKRLVIQSIPITKLTGFKGATRLKSFDLNSYNQRGYSQVNDISGLKDCYNLKNIYIDESSIIIFPYFEHFNVIYRITIIECSSLVHISGLGNLKNLRVLFIRECINILSYKAISNLNKLVILKIRECNLENIEFVTNLKKLNELNLDKNNITDINPIKGLNLMRVTLSSNKLESITALEDMTSLHLLYLSHNLIEDISPLKNLVGMFILDLSHNKIVNFKAGIKNMIDLVRLNMGYNETNEYEDFGYLLDKKIFKQLYRIVLPSNELKIIYSEKFRKAGIRLGQSIKLSTVTHIKTQLFLSNSGNYPNSGNHKERRSITLSNKINYIEILQKIKNSIVKIYCKNEMINMYDTSESGFPMISTTGSAFFTNEYEILGDKTKTPNKLYILTNFHVVQYAKNIEIKIRGFSDERFSLTLFASSINRDVAFLEFSNKPESTSSQPFFPLKLGDSDNVDAGTIITAIGHPRGLKNVTTTMGIISSEIQILDGYDFIQIDAAINPGNSGGPSVTEDGVVIGINTKGISGSNNMGFIIPINQIRAIGARAILTGDKLVDTPSLGAEFQKHTTEDTILFAGAPMTYEGVDGGGTYIKKVYTSSIMDRASVKEGDFLYKINGNRVNRHYDIKLSDKWLSVIEFLNKKMEGDTINITVFKKKEKKMEIFELIFKQDPQYPIRMYYPMLEDTSEVFYSVKFGGMTLMMLTENHFLFYSMMFIRIPSKTIDEYHPSYKPENRHKKVVVVSKIVIGSDADNTKSVTVGSIIKKVGVKNKEQIIVHTPKDVEIIIQNNIGQFIRFETETGNVFVLK